MAYDPDHNWAAQAACVHDEAAELDDYFPEAGARPPERLLKLCLSCPVRHDCLEHAIRGGFEAGWFGGLSPTDRKGLGPDDLSRL